MYLTIRVTFVTFHGALCFYHFSQIQTEKDMLAPGSRANVCKYLQETRTEEGSEVQVEMLKIKRGIFIFQFILFSTI